MESLCCLKPLSGTISKEQSSCSKPALVKRVIGLPGDTVEIRGGELYLNGEPQREDYIAEEMNSLYDGFSVTVPDGYYFVMGDNRNNSHDSRAEDVNAIPIENVLGKARCRIWPLDRGGSIY